MKKLIEGCLCTQARRHSLLSLIAAAVVVAFVTINMAGSDSAASQVGDRNIVKPPLKDEVEIFMKMKLEAVNLAMSGVARDDFDTVRQSGEELIRLSREAVWNQRANAGYVQDTADFVDSVQFMLRMADEEDVEGVTLGYAKVVMSCSTCHRHVRGPKIASTTPLRAEILVGAAAAETTSSAGHRG